MGARFYVNLEPCAHLHRTPRAPTRIILAARRVVISMADPTSACRARHRQAQAAGIETVVGVHEDRALRLNEFYVKHRLTGRPFVSQVRDEPRRQDRHAHRQSPAG
jgi:pyrimidine deaminase RibD-like protein